MRWTMKLLLAMAALAALSAPAAAQSWPNKPVKIVVPFGPGGPADVYARILGQELSEVLKQQFIIDNKPGAGAVIGADYVAKAKPDGYTFLIGAAGVVTNSLVRKNMPYADSDLVPVGMIAVAPSVIVVNPSVPANNLREFAEWAKSRGANGVNWSTAGTASTPHFVAEMLKESGISNLNIIPYKSGSEGVTAQRRNREGCGKDHLSRHIRNCDRPRYSVRARRNIEAPTDHIQHAHHICRG